MTLENSTAIKSPHYIFLLPDCVLLYIERGEGIPILIVHLKISEKQDIIKRDASNKSYIFQEEKEIVIFALILKWLVKTNFDFLMESYSISNQFLWPFCVKKYYGEIIEKWILFILFQYFYFILKYFSIHIKYSLFEKLHLNTFVHRIMGKIDVVKNIEKS